MRQSLRFIVVLTTFVFFKVFSSYRYMNSDIVNIVFGSFVGLLFLCFAVLIVSLKLLESLAQLLAPLLNFIRLVLSLVTVHFSKYILNLVLDFFLLIHRLRFFFLLGASSYDPLTKIFYDSISVLKGELLMEFYNFSSKFIFDEDFNLPTSIFSKTPIFDNARNFFYMQVFSNLFERVLVAQHSIRTFFFFSAWTNKEAAVPRMFVYPISSLVKSDDLAGEVVLKKSLNRMRIPFWNRFNSFFRFFAVCSELFHFEFFLYLHNLNLFLINTTKFSCGHIFLLRYFRSVRAAMIFILVNLENDSFLHFINLTLYRLSICNYYTKADWANLINTYDFSATNSLAFNGDARSDLAFILKVSLCYVFLIGNYLIFYLASIIFSIFKFLFYASGYARSFLFYQPVGLANFGLFATNFTYIYMEFCALYFCKIVNQIKSRSKALFASKKSKASENFALIFIRRFNTRFESFSIFDISFIFMFLGFRFLRGIRLVWSVIILMFYQWWPVIYLLFFCKDYVEAKLIPPVLPFLSNVTRDFYYNKLFRQVVDKLTVVGSVDGRGRERMVGNTGALIISPQFGFGNSNPLFDFFSLKFFSDYYSRFCVTRIPGSFGIMFFMNIYLSRFFAFVMLYGSRDFYNFYNKDKEVSLEMQNFDVLFSRTMRGYKQLFVAQYYVGLFVTYCQFYFVGPCVKLWKIFESSLVLVLFRFSMFSMIEIVLFLRKFVFFTFLIIYGALFYCLWSVGFFIVSLYFVCAIYLLFIYFFSIICCSIIILCLLLLFFLFIKINGTVMSKFFSKQWFVFWYLFIYIRIRLVFFQYKLAGFLRQRNIGFLEILSIFFLVRNDLKKYEIMHTQISSHVFNSATVDIAVSNFLYQYLLNFEKASNAQREMSSQQKLSSVDFTMFKSKFKVPLEALEKFKRSKKKIEFERVQLKRDLFPEFEYHKYLRSRDFRNLSLFRFRKSLEPVDFYFDPLLDDVRVFDSNHTSFMSFDFLKVFYIDDASFTKLLGYFRYVFARKNLSFFYDDLDRLSIFRVRYAKLSPLFRYFYLKREKIKYLSALYVFGNINPFTFSIVLNWIQNYKILRAVLNLYKNLDSSLLNYGNRIQPVFQIFLLANIVGAVCVSFHILFDILCCICLAIFAVYCLIALNLTVMGGICLGLCLLRLKFNIPLLVRPNIFVEYLMRHPHFFTLGTKFYSIFNRYARVSIIMCLTLRLSFVFYLRLIVITFFVSVSFVLGLVIVDLGIDISKVFDNVHLSFNYELITSNVILVYWLYASKQDSSLVLNVFEITCFDLGFYVVLFLILSNFINFIFIHRLWHFSADYYLRGSFRLLTVWALILLWLFPTGFVSFIRKGRFVPYYILAELDLLVEILKRQNRFSRSVIRRWTSLD